MTKGEGGIPLHDLVEARLHEKGVRLAEQDLISVTAGYSTLQQWRTVLTAVLLKQTEPDVIFAGESLVDGS